MGFRVQTPVVNIIHTNKWSFSPMKLYISLVGELASIGIQNYAGLLAKKLAYSHQNWLIVQYHGLMT